MAAAKSFADESAAGGVGPSPGRPRRADTPMGLEAVARQAGVSIATVSRVLNKHPGVRPRTAELVLKTISQLQALPEAAGGHTTAATPETLAGNVAVVFLGWQGIAGLRPVYLELLSGIRSQLEELGSRMMVFEAAQAADLGRHLRRGDVDGAITLLSTRPVPPDAELEQLAAMLPTVRVMGTPAPRGAVHWDHITPNHAAIGRLAFDYLAAQGCRRVAYLSLGANTPELGGLSDIERSRAMSFLVAAREAGLDADIYWRGHSPACQRIFGTSGHTAATAADVTRLAVRSMPAGAGGLFVNSDFDMALLYPILAEQGVRPGADVRLVGCDNSNSYLAPLTPRPASIDVRAAAIGQQAVLRLVHRVRYLTHTPVLMEVTPELAVAPA